MRYFVFLLGFLALALALASCTTPASPTQGPAGGETPGVAAPGVETPDTVTPEAETPTASPGAPAPEDPLANTQWTLESFGPVDAVEPVVEGSTVTLEFGEGGQAGGTGGCNSYGTNYEVNGNQITFGDITSTLILCEAEGVMDQEGSYFQALQAANQFDLANDRLQIEYGGGEGLLSFVRSGTQPTQTTEPAAEWLCSEAVAVTESGWKVCRSEAYGFEVQYPPEEKLGDWTPQSVRIFFPVTPGTNLNEKWVDLTAREVVETCASPHGIAFGIPGEPVQINGLEFIKQSFQEGAAGNIYDIIAYSIEREDGLCVTLEFVLRAGNPDAYATRPPLYDIEAESAVFEEIVATFQWLETAP